MGLAQGLLRLVLGRRPPRVEGVETREGLVDSVTIRRDGWHVPHISATCERDAWFALGFCQGQDRPWQLELFKRLAAGRLAALVGPDGLALDRLMRRLGLHRAAAAQLEASPPPVRRSLEAFAAGVEAGMGPAGCPRRPHALAMLGAKPSPHTATDIVAAFKLVGFLLSANWYDELIRLQVLIRDGQEALERVDPAGAGAGLPGAVWPPGEAAGPTVDGLLESLTLLRRWIPVGGGSNSWVLDGSRTATGRPLLANDPHLPPTLPSFWYLAHLETPELSIAGATFAGAPAFGAGHNGHGAWGITAGHADDTDLFLQLVSGTRVWTGQEWAEAEVRSEEIDVRFGADVVERVLVTGHGPLVSPALDLGEAGSGLADARAHLRRDRADAGESPHPLDALGSEPVRYGLSICGMAMDTGPLEGFLTAHRARSLDEFRESFAHWPGMSLSLVWADTSGTTGWQLVGELPVRGIGHGAVPLPAWQLGVGWTGRVPFAAMPHGRDPAAGLLATANNQPVPHADARAFLGVDFLDSYRLAAIIERLRERHDWDVPATRALQRDNRSLVWRDLADTVLAVDPGDDPDAALALRLLREWDGRVTGDAAAASVFELLLAELTVHVDTAAAPGAAPWLLGRSPIPDLLPHTLPGLRNARLVELLVSQPDDWFEEGWDAVIRGALATAVERLRDRHGNDPAEWGWARVRPVYLRHQLAAAVPGLGHLFDRGPVELSGDSNTIAQAGVPPTAPLGDPLAIPSLRMIVDVGEWSAARWALPGGQSGNPVSPHYDDLLPRWESGEGIPIPWTREAVEAATESVLRLLPSR